MEKSLVINNVSLILSGGLGNQLFQLAAAKSLSGTGSITLITDIGNPRTNHLNLPAISSYDLGTEVSLVSYDKMRLIWNRLFNFLLNLSSHGARNFWSRSAFKAVEGLSLIISKFTRFQPIVLSNGVGFDESFSLTHDCSVMIGCFHSYKWVYHGQTLEFMKSLKPISSPHWLTELSYEAQVEAPIIVHIRLGDYLGIPNLSHLDNDYFVAGLKECLSERPSAPVWIMSDDVVGVRERLSDPIWKNAKFIAIQDSDAVLNLEILRLGGSFVLSNSTFSWWGATLSRTEDPLVVVPENWFRATDNPVAIYPPQWKLLKVSP